ncbi:SusC/RagA family TonB-linked outer membrane protein [Niastella vici]|uniref:SusC/RagA family TonB-linked outer membrane protein n=1 Tax=Niastella vici TaxID=1703345 RepID=A0A1V9FWX2_9BACT|nr:SusC/RagA family TonB-linked outer membrane protein [Niastella vici]OQP62788.1 SusC/RagA family TonB-linked outer membrane protein [Niastella vici]
MKKLFSPGSLLILLLAALVPFSNLQAQTQPTIVRGKIISSRDKKPIHGASVTEIDNDERIIRGVSTDIDGNFALKMSNPKNKISISYIGFKSIVQSPDGKTSITVSLVPANSDMDEIIVVADKKSDNGMMPVSERDRTFAAATISAKEMEEMQATSIDQALQGRLPGLDITASSGDPGAAMSIKIRGTSSINSSDNPLIVVDGMPYETEIPSDFNFGTADEQGYAALLNISPSDIKDITVLKDAAATAVWGARAAGGVLIITTKRGKMGKPALTYTFKSSITKAPDAIPMLNGDQYSMLIPELVMNKNGQPLNTQLYKEFQYDPNDPYYYYNYSNNTDWVRAIRQTGYIQDHNLSMSGGGRKARYFTSLDYTKQIGTTLGNDLSRINTRINLDYTVSARIRFRTDLSYSHSLNNRNYADNLLEVAYKKMPNMSIYEYDEYGNKTPNFFSPAQNVQGQYGGINSSNKLTGTVNPVAMATAAYRRILSERVIPHFQLQYDLKPSVLQAIFDIQFDINNTKNKSFLPQIATGRPWTETVVNRVYDGDADAFSVQSKTSLTYTPHLKENHKLIFFSTFLTSDYKYVSHQAQTSNTASTDLQDPSVPSRTANTDLNLTATQIQSRSIGALVNGQYAFKDRYIFNAALRMDGNSKFGPAHRYGFFPSVSARWRLSDEWFMRPLQKWVNDLSIRGSYGHSGREPKNDYTFYNTYNTFAYTYLGQSAIYPATMQLNNLTWEVNKGANLGFNLIMLNRRINLDVDLYRNRIDKMFFSGLQISSFSGFDKVDMNVGTMDNQGWEVNLNTVLVRKKDYSIEFNFNIAHNDNIIRQISEYYPREKGNIEANGQYKSLLQVNNPFGSFYGFRYKGVYADKNATMARDAKGQPIVGPNGQQIYMRFNYPNVDYMFQPGDAIYEDINHDGNINYMDVVYLGNGNPKLTGGFGPTLSWKNQLRVTVFFNYRLGQDIINGTKMSTTAMYNFDNQSTAVLRRWRKEGDITDMPRAVYGTGYNWLGSDRYVEDGSFMRLRSATIRYNFTQKALSRFKLGTLSAYITAENLLTLTRYTGQDPEVSARGSDPFRVAMDYSMTPPSKTFTIGLSTTF